MRSKTVLLRFLYGLLFIVLFQGEAYAQFSGGSGTQQDPFQITDINQLQEIRSHLESHYILLKDLDATETSAWNNGRGFEPIGNTKSPFTGTFNGNDHIISGLTIDRPKREYIGLFGYTDKSGIANLRLQNVAVTGSNETGAVVGKMNGGYIKNVSVSGQIIGRTHTGGLTGFNRGGRIEYASVKATVSGRSYVGGVAGINRGKMLRISFSGTASGTGHNLGGIAGSNYDGVVTESVSEGEILGETASSAGGISGSNGGTIERSHSGANITARSYVGGLVGNNHNGVILRSYATGNVQGFNLVGGLAGVNRMGSHILEAYSTGTVNGTIDFGGFIGVNRDPVIAGYWNKDTAGLPDAVSKGSNEGITGLTNGKMSGVQSFTAMKGFSFNRNWGYVQDAPPIHLWQIPYFAITKVDPDSNLISGDLATIEVLIKNVGSQPDTNHVIFKNGDGDILDEYPDLILDPGKQFTLFFNWQTALDDHGKYPMEVQTGEYHRPFSITVSRTPDPVELNDPYVLEEHVNLKPRFDWDPAFLAENYELQISRNENFLPVDVAISEIDTTFYTLSKPLKHYTYYHWRVRGVNADTVGPWSDISEFTTIIEKPVAVKLKAPETETKDASTQPTFIWYSAERSEEYFLQIASDEDFEKVIFDTTVVASDTTLAMKRTLPEKNVLYWRMKSLNMGGESGWSEARTFVPLIPPPKRSKVNTLDYALEQNYPNPFNPVTYIQYSIPEPGRVHLEVLNMLGQTVAILVDGYKAAGWHTAVFDASELSSGFYIYRIKARDFEATKKLSLVK